MIRKNSTPCAIFDLVEQRKGQLLKAAEIAKMPSIPPRFLRSDQGALDAVDDRIAILTLHDKENA